MFIRRSILAGALAFSAIAYFPASAQATDGKWVCGREYRSGALTIQACLKRWISYNQFQIQGFVVTNSSTSARTAVIKVQEGWQTVTNQTWQWSDDGTINKPVNPGRTFFQLGTQSGGLDDCFGNRAAVTYSGAGGKWSSTSSIITCQSTT